MCSTGSRLLIQESIKDEFLERILRHAATAQPGDPLDPDTRMGALVDDGQTRRLD
jgi:acyl-CoA reductase-like NAD-dependent aldehyde dehydrogenase